jgi:hypothetical protein
MDNSGEIMEGLLMQKSITFLLIFFILLINPYFCLTAEQQNKSSTQDAKGFGSPEEVWTTLMQASDREDWGQVYDCLTPAARDDYVFKSYVNLMMSLEWFGLRRAEDKETQMIVQQCDALFSSQGVDIKQIEEEVNKLKKEEIDQLREESADPDKMIFKQLLFRLIKDKRRFFVEATSLTMKIQDTMAKVFAKLGESDVKNRKDLVVEVDEELPPSIGKIVNVKVHGDSARGKLTEKLQDSEVLITGGKRIRFVTDTKFFRRIDGKWFVEYEINEPIQTYSHKIAETDIPFEKRINMDAGDALTFDLPNGKSVAVWCEGDKRNFIFAAEQTTASGLKTHWGEKPFKSVGYKREKQADGSTVLGETNSYIKQGPVITKGDKTTTYRLFIDKWQIDIIEDLQAKEELPVTIQIRKQTSKLLQLFGIE